MPVSRGVAGERPLALPPPKTDMGFTSTSTAPTSPASPRHAYFYRVIEGGVNVTPESGYRFSTPGPGPVSFLVLGDSGDGSSHQLA